MTYLAAKRLHNGDEITVKATNNIIRVVGDVEIDGKDVFIYCTDGNLYHHRDIH